MERSPAAAIDNVDPTRTLKSEQRLPLATDENSWTLTGMANGFIAKLACYRTLLPADAFIQALPLGDKRQ